MDFETDFVKKFSDSVSQKRTHQPGIKPIQLIPNQYTYGRMPFSETERGAFLHLLAGGFHSVSLPFSFSFLSIDCQMLLYTESGSGALTHAGITTPLTARQLLFFDCAQRFSIQSDSLPWRFKIFFLAGRQLPIYGKYLKSEKAPCFYLEDYSPIHGQLTRLLGMETEAGLCQLVQMNQLLTDILSPLYLSKNPAGTVSQAAGTPSYLIELKDYFDHHYKKPFSLDACQEHYKISKYRICREFSRYFGEPPLHYRNKIRLEAAKELLLTTEQNVHEISSMVGFENVNHFIKLFKKTYGNTPNAFKQMVSEGQCASRSHAQ